MSGPQERIAKTYIIGPHQLDLEFPDLVQVHYHGDVELEHFLAFEAAMMEIPPPTKLYLLRNASNGGVLTERVRRHIAAMPPTTRMAAIATYGASFRSKTVFSNMQRAMKTLRPLETPIEFFSTEQEARAWLDDVRRELHSP